jgi:hypothetical protein
MENYHAQQPFDQQQPPLQPQQLTPVLSKGKGLGIAAMVLGIIAVVLSFLPFINILGIPLAIVGLILGVVAVIMARGKRGPIAFGIVGVACSSAALIITIAMYASAAASLADLSDSFNESGDALNTSAPAAQVEPTQDADSRTTDEVATDAATDTVFVPQNVSDETIGSINTYNDYLAMYWKIVEDYFANYEDAIKDTVLWDEATFTEMRESYEESYQSQKDMYGSMGDMPLVGKDDLVKFLIDYRDNLAEFTDSIKTSLQ